MSIRTIGRSLGPTPTAPATPTAPSTRAQTSSPAAPARPAAAPRTDSVQISDAARAMAAGGASQPSGLTSERVQQLRERVLQGAYNSTAVADQVARRILSSGDA